MLCPEARSAKGTEQCVPFAKRPGGAALCAALAAGPPHCARYVPAPRSRRRKPLQLITEAHSAA